MIRNTIAYPTQQSPSPSRGIPCSHKRGNEVRVTAVYLFHQEWRKSIPKHAGPQAKGSNPTTGCTLLWVLWARKPFSGKFNHWKVSRKEAQKIIFTKLILLRLFPSKEFDVLFMLQYIRLGEFRLDLSG